MAYAREHDGIVFTNNLDFGVILALTRASGPSVIQVRTVDVNHDALGADVIRILFAHPHAIEEGAIVTIDSGGNRVRLLPIAKRPPEPVSLRPGTDGSGQQHFSLPRLRCGPLARKCIRTLPLDCLTRLCAMISRPDFDWLCPKVLQPDAMA